MITDTLEKASVDLLNRCLGRDDAVSLLRSTLFSLGLQDPKVEATGVRQMPMGSAGDARSSHRVRGDVPAVEDDDGTSGERDG